MAQGLGQPQVLSQELVHMWSRPRLFPQEGEASPTGMHSKTLPSCLLPGQQVEPCVFCDTDCGPGAMASGQLELISLHRPTSSRHRRVLIL